MTTIIFHSTRAISTYKSIVKQQSPGDYLENRIFNFIFLLETHWFKKCDELINLGIWIHRMGKDEKITKFTFYYTIVGHFRNIHDAYKLNMTTHTEQINDQEKLMMLQLI